MPRRNNDDYTELKELAIVGIQAELKRLNTILARLTDTPPPPAAGTKPQPVGTLWPGQTHGYVGLHAPASAAQRKAVSKRMKRYWAARRATNPPPASPRSPDVVQDRLKKGRKKKGS